MKRKMICCFLIALFLSFCIPIGGVEAKIGPQTAQTSTSNISLANAIQNVKQIFTIPSSLNEFSSSFESSNNRQTWRLEWRKKNNDESFMAEVDAVSGEILSMNHWKQNDSTFSKTPSLSILEARQKGQALLMRLLPGKAAELKFKDENSLIPLGEYDSPKYNMTWQRYYKNVPVVMDAAKMIIDMQSGEITDYSISWTKQQLPDPTAVISSEKAVQIFVSQDILQLQYLLDRPWLRKADRSASKPQLIYALKNSSNGMIDAFTGQPVTEESYGSYYDMVGAENMKIQSGGSNAEVPTVELSPEEQKEIANSSQFLSKEQAVQAVNKMISIPASMVLESASLEKNWQDPSLRNWNLGWRSTSSAAVDYIWVQIDAANGELLSFNCNDQADAPADKINAKSMTQAEAQKMAEAFIRKVQLKHWSEIKLENSNTQAKPLQTNQSSWSFHYIRLVNGIPCPDNGISINVDANLNQVNSFSIDWNRNEFPSAAKALAKTQANEKFLTAAPLVLRYVGMPDYNGAASNVKLVYMPDMKDDMRMLDAITGTALDSNGQPISNTIHANHFQDIKGHFGETEITLLGQAGLFGEYGNYFHPDESISLRSLLRAMLTAKEGIYNTQGISDEEIMQRCRQLAWIDDKQSQNNEVSREMLAQLIIRFLNIDYLSQVQGIYRLPYQDEAAMSASTKAYAALCWGLGIIKADGKRFDSGHIVSRAEAAIALAKTLSIKTRS